MKKIYYLKTCSTCQRIIKALNLFKDFTQQDIKITPISASGFRSAQIYVREL